MIGFLPSGKTALRIPSAARKRREKGSPPIIFQGESPFMCV